MIIPVGNIDPADATLFLVEKRLDGGVLHRPIGRVGFVSIISNLQGGWSKGDMDKVEENRRLAQLQPLEKIANKNTTDFATLRPWYSCPSACSRTP